MKNDITKAKEEVTKLLRLLEQPEPGLITWGIAVNRQAKMVATIFGYGGQNDPTVKL